MSRRTHEQSIEYWGDVFREHRASGLSIRQFCDERRIVQTQFYKWRKRLTESASTQKKQVPSFVPVTLVDAPTQARSSQIEILIDGSLSVLVHDGFDAKTLSKVIRVLKPSSNGKVATC